MSRTVTLAHAVTQLLQRQNLAVFSLFDVARMAWSVVKARQFENTPLRLQRSMLDIVTLRRLTFDLIDSGILTALDCEPAEEAYFVLRGTALDVAALVCAVDPFGQLSHFSAMQLHGLTSMKADQLYVSTRAHEDWRTAGKERAQRLLGADFVDYVTQNLPLPKKPQIKRLRGHPVRQYAPGRQGSFDCREESGVRVTTIGQTFLDMLREPELCGGMTLVTRVYAEHGEENLPYILDELARHGRKRDQSRALQMLERACELDSAYMLDLMSEEAVRRTPFLRFETRPDSGSASGPASGPASAAASVAASRPVSGARFADTEATLP